MTTQTFILHKGHPDRELVKGNAQAFLDRLPESHSWRVTVERYVKTRTDPQNHALFGVAYPPLVEATGHTKDELHEAFCRRFFGTVERDVCGQRITRPLRTTTTDENGRRNVIDAGAFSDFYAMVQQVGSEAGVFVPDPDPLHAEAA